jgi:hypothetical protein
MESWIFYRVWINLASSIECIEDPRFSMLNKINLTSSMLNKINLTSSMLNKIKSYIFYA